MVPLPFLPRRPPRPVSARGSRIVALALMSLLAAVPSTRGQADGDALVFKNGDRIRGSLAGLDAGAGRLTWASSSALEPLAFRLGSVAMVECAAPTPAGTDGRTLLRLTNGDIWSGKLVSLDAEAIHLDSWAAGPIKIPTAVVSQILPVAGQARRYLDGPGEAKTWRFKSSGGGNWTLREGRLESSPQAFVGRAFSGMRQEGLRLSFHGQWSGYSALTLFFYADAQDANPRNGYSLQLAGNNLFLNRLQDGRVERLSQHTRSTTGTKVTFELYVSRADGEFLLLLDGQEAMRTKDPRGFRGQHDGLVFFATHPTPFTITTLSAEAWTGPLPEGQDSADSPDQDSVMFANQDRIAGTLQSIQDGVAKITTPFADLDVPLGRIGRIHLASKNRRNLRGASTDVKVLLADQGRVTISLQSIAPAGAAGTAAGVGPVVLRRDAITRIELVPQK